jgi:uncharacterized protein DUF6166
VGLRWQRTGNDRLAVDLHQPFKWKFVACFGDTWILTQEEIITWVQAKAIATSCCPTCHSDDPKTRCVISKLGGEPGECDDKYHQETVGLCGLCGKPYVRPHSCTGGPVRRDDALSMSKMRAR